MFYNDHESLSFANNSGATLIYQKKKNSCRLEPSNECSPIVLLSTSSIIDFSSAMEVDLISDLLGADPFSRHFSRRQETASTAVSGSTRKRSRPDDAKNDEQTVLQKRRVGEKSLSMNSWRPSAWAYLRDRIGALRSGPRARERSRASIRYAATFTYDACNGSKYQSSVG